MKPLLVAAVLVLSPGLALAQNFTGYWTITSGGATPVTLQCNLLQRGAILDGNCAQADGPSGALLKGSVDGTRANWEDDFTVDGQKAEAKFKGDITAERAMKGELTLSGQSEPFTATKDY